MVKTRTNNFANFLPSLNLLPLLFSYSLDHVAVSTYWIFFGIFLSENFSDANYLYTSIAVVLAVPAIISVLGTTILSSFSDRTGKRRILLLLSKIMLMTQYTLLIFFNDKIWHILLILGIFSIFTQIYYTQHSAIITLICPPDKKGQVSSFQVLFASIGWMVGSALSDVIYNWKGITGSLAFAAGFAVVAGFVAMLSPTKPKEIKEELQNDNNNSDDSILQNNEEQTNHIVEPVTKTESYSSYFQIFKRKKIIFLLITLAVLDFGFGPFNVITSVYFKEAGLSDVLIAKSNTIATAIGMLILLFSGALLDRTGRKRVLLISIGIYPILYSLMFFLSSYPTALFVIYLYPLYALKVPTSNTIMADLTAENERGRGMSLIQIEQIIFGNLGAILACFIADVFPTDWFSKFIPSGIFFIPLFPIVFGSISLVLAFILVKETNPKVLAKKIAIKDVGVVRKEL